MTEVPTVPQKSAMRTKPKEMQMERNEQGAVRCTEVGEKAASEDIHFASHTNLSNGSDDINREGISCYLLKSLNTASSELI